MNFKQLECFKALAQTLNFSKAANSIFISQSSFSRIISSLESELGCILLERSKINPQLTPAGIMIYDRFKIILDEMDEVNKIASRAAQGNLADLNVGTLWGGLDEIGKKIIHQFKIQHAEVSYEIYEYNDNELIKALKSEMLDIGFVICDANSYVKDFGHLKINSVKTCLLCSKYHPLANRERVTLNDIKDEKYIVLKQSKSMHYIHYIMDICLKNGFSPNISIYADSLFILLDCIQQQFGIAILSEEIIKLAKKDVVAIPIEGLEPTEYNLIWRKNENRKVIKQLIDFAGEIVISN